MQETDFCNPIADSCQPIVGSSMQVSRGWFLETAFGKLRLITREAGETKEAKPTGARRVVPSENRVSDWSAGTPVYDDAPPHRAP